MSRIKRTIQHFQSHRNDVLYKTLTYLLFVCFGLFPFFLINAIFAELSIFVDAFQQQSIGSWLGTVFQVANIISLLYISLSSLLKIGDTVSLTLLQVLGIVDCVLIALFWRWQWQWPGSHDTAAAAVVPLGILLFTFVSGIVGCSGVVFMFAHVSQYGPLYISAVNVGMSLSGGVTSVLSLVQTYVPFLDITVYMFICCAVLLVSFASFCIVFLFQKRLFPAERRENAAHLQVEDNDDDDDDEQVRQVAADWSGHSDDADGDENEHIMEGSSIYPTYEDSKISGRFQEEYADVEGGGGGGGDGNTLYDDAIDDSNTAKMAPRDGSAGSAAISLQDMVATLRSIGRNAPLPYAAIAINGLLTYFLTPGIQPYLATTSTGQPDMVLLKWISNTFLICNIFGGVVTSVPFLRIRHILIASAVEIALAAWLIAASLLRNTSLFAEVFSGLGFTYVIAYGMQSFLSSYINTMAYIKIREGVEQAHVARATKLASVSYQICCMVGTLLCLGFTSVVFESRASSQSLIST